MSAKDEEIIRQAKLEKFRNLGINPYPSRTSRTNTVVEILNGWDDFVSKETKVVIVGRLLSKRTHGGIMFCHIEDGTGKLQIACKKDVLGTDLFDQFQELYDSGDILEAEGTLFTTKIGEKTLMVTRFAILTKTILPLPDKWHGITDTESRFRKRYLDLIMNPEVKARFADRIKIISALRSFLDGRGFLEVETPTLQPIYGGGYARPFKTHHNALDADFYLRISDEMYLKRLLVGGFEKVYEITKVFRNEGIDHDHNPEFTMFEAQIAYQDYRYGMDIFEEIFEGVAKDALGTTEIKHDGVTINVERPWKRMSLVESVREVGGIDVLKWKTADDAKEEVKKHLKNKTKADELAKMQKIGEIMAFAFEELVEEKLIQPTIIYDYPVEVSPLAKKCTDAEFTERFEAFALGSEIGNNYSELNDPIDLSERFFEEKKKAETGNEEAHQTDEDYLEAIKHGMPPACGLGIGIDRMVMLLTGTHSIKEVILFPTLRPESSSDEFSHE